MPALRALPIGPVLLLLVAACGGGSAPGGSPAAGAEGAEGPTPDLAAPDPAPPDPVEPPAAPASIAAEAGPGFGLVRPPRPGGGAGSLGGIGERIAPAAEEGDVDAAVAAVDLEPGETSWIETRFRGGDKLKTRRQVLRIGEGIQNHGPYTRWYENGVVAEEGSFDHGLRTGHWVERFETGQTKSEIDYLEGEIHGLKREHSDIGYVKKETEFDHGLRHGSYTTWTMIYEGQRTVRIQGTHDHGKKVGLWIQNYADGTPRERGHYEDDLQVGAWTSWHANGELAQEAEYLEGQWHGRVATYDEEGRPLTEGQYEHGVPVGVQREYHPEGPLKSEKTYVDGRPNGIARTYHTDGSKASEGQLVDGLRQGEWTFWTAEGEVDPEWSGTYLDGERVPDGGSGEGGEPDGG